MPKVGNQPNRKTATSEFSLFCVCVCVFLYVFVSGVDCPLGLGHHLLCTLCPAEGLGEFAQIASEAM